DEESLALGKFHKDQTEGFKVEKTKHTRELRKLQTEAATAGISISNRALRNPEAARDAIAGREAARARILQRESLTAANTSEGAKS
ncbi:MAG: hypothetical protein ACXWDN_12525, partial [Limisphaerales bacterium]